LISTLSVNKNIKIPYTTNTPTHPNGTIDLRLEAFWCNFVVSRFGGILINYLFLTIKLVDLFFKHLRDYKYSRIFVLKD